MIPESLDLLETAVLLRHRTAPCMVPVRSRNFVNRSIPRAGTDYDCRYCRTVGAKIRVLNFHFCGNLVMAEGA